MQILTFAIHLGDLYNTLWPQVWCHEVRQVPGVNPQVLPRFIISKWRLVVFFFWRLNNNHIFDRQFLGVKWDSSWQVILVPENCWLKVLPNRQANFFSGFLQQTNKLMVKIRCRSMWIPVIPVCFHSNNSDDHFLRWRYWHMWPGGCRKKTHEFPPMTWMIFINELP